MPTKNSRDYLDAVRGYAEAKLSDEGATIDAGNMNIPLQNDQRVAAAQAWCDAREVEVDALWTPAMDAVWASVQEEVSAGWEQAVTAAGVAGFQAEMWQDAQARTLIKSMTRLLSKLVCYHRNGGV